MPSRTGQPSGSVVKRSADLVDNSATAKSVNKTTTVPSTSKHSELTNRRKNNSPKKPSTTGQNSDNFPNDEKTGNGSNHKGAMKGQQDKKDKKVADSKIKRKFISFIKYLKSWLLWTIIVAAICAVVYKKTLDSLHHESAKQELLASVGEAGLNLFRQYDLNEDSYLSLDEFIPLTHRLIDVRVPYEYNFEFDAEDEAFVVEASFVPLQISSIKKNPEDDVETQSYFTGLREWQQPAKNIMIYAAKHLHSFLPTDPELMSSVGQVYTLWANSNFQYITGQLPTNNRYFPPQFTDKQAIFHSLLSMFHPRPFLMSRFEPQGAVACIRAYNSEFVDVAFRIHAEFQLNEPPNLPFWFSPAYFSGNLIINKNSTTVLKFHLTVPTQKKLNVDMEWLTDDRDANNMEVNIGFLPKMELNSYAKSSVQTEYIEMEASGRDKAEQEVSRISWTEEISMEEAMKSLQLKMYPFKEVPYYEFASAFKRAQLEQKLVHFILLWGVLDDQSC